MEALEGLLTSIRKYGSQKYWSKKSLQGFNIMLEVRKLEVWKLEVRKLEVKSDEVKNVEVRSMEVGKCWS